MFKSKRGVNIQPQAIDTIIGEHCVVQGDLSTSQSMKVDGQVQGNLSAQGAVILGEHAVVKGNVGSTSVTVYGYLEGDIHTQTLQLKKTARIYGNVHAQLFEVEQGAVYQGGVVMQSSGSNPQLEDGGADGLYLANEE